jgi:hypothetical protein
MSNAPAAAWYPDPEDATQLRYWDGQQWTEHRAPAQPQQPVQQEPTAPASPPQQDQPQQAPHAAEPPGTEPRKAEAKIPLFGARKHARQTAEELDRAQDEIALLRAEMDRLGVLDVADLERQREALKEETNNLRDSLNRVKTSLEREIADLKTRVVKTQEAEILQEVGLYEYRHPLSNSVAYKAELAKLQDQIKTLAKRDGGAIETAHGWTVNGSEAQGKKMLRDYSKLMLRAYNAEADNLVRGLKPYKLDSAVDRLNKVTGTIERLGKTMSIRVTSQYHRLRIKELELTADYQEMLAREKEEERAEKERLREQRKLEQEIAREKARLDRERQHYANALQALIDKGDTEGADRMRAQLEDIDKAIEDVDYRAANIRAGYVYVISNVGALGERMIKVGMTRRLDPMDRVRELSDASVPFNFDVHAMFFSDDAYGIEAEMHRRLAEKRVNRVNLRREFFYATPAEARDLLKELTGELLQFDEEPEALEYHQSLHAAGLKEQAPSST